MHGSMTDLRQLVAESQVQRPKTDLGGMVLVGEIDGREEQGTDTVMTLRPCKSHRDFC